MNKLFYVQSNIEPDPNEIHELTFVINDNEIEIWFKQFSLSSNLIDRCCSISSVIDKDRLIDGLQSVLTSEQDIDITLHCKSPNNTVMSIDNHNDHITIKYIINSDTKYQYQCSNVQLEEVMMTLKEINNAK